MTVILSLLLLAQTPGPSNPDARPLIASLGSPRWSARELAQRELETLCYTDGRTLHDVAAGLDHRDPEVRARCYWIIRRVQPCSVCHGLGLACNVYGGSEDEERLSAVRRLQGDRFPVVGPLPAYPEQAMSTVTLTAEPRSTFRAKVGDTIRFAMEHGPGGSYGWHCDYQVGDYIPVPGATASADGTEVVSTGFDNFRFVAGNASADPNSCALECLKPGKFAFGTRYSAGSDRTNSSSGFPFTIYLEVSP